MKSKDKTKTMKSSEVLERPKGKQLTTTAHIYYQMHTQFSPTRRSVNV